MQDIKVVYLDILIAVIGRLDILDEEPRILISDSYLIKIDLDEMNCRLLSFPFFTKENSFFINSSKVLTIAEPTRELLSEYHKLLSEQIISDNTKEK